MISNILFVNCIDVVILLLKFMCFGVFMMLNIIVFFRFVCNGSVIGVDLSEIFFVCLFIFVFVYFSCLLFVS